MGSEPGGKRMYAARLIMFCLLSLSIGITSQAATFEKVSSAFSGFRDVHLQCTPSDVAVWTRIFDETVDDFDTNSASWGYTTMMKTDPSFLMSLDSAENAETAMYYEPPGGGNDAAARVALDGSDPYHNRVSTAAFHRPVFTFWQPGWYEPHSYGIDLSVRTEATAFYRIAPLGGETVGDEITLTVEGWTEYEENCGGPNAFSGHSNYLTNIATAPVSS